HAFGPRSTEGRGHQRLVVRVRARPRQQDRTERETRRRCLRRDQLATHCMHRHAIGSLVEGGEQPDELDVALLAKLVQGPGAVLPRAPRQEDTACHAATIPSNRAEATVTTCM